MASVSVCGSYDERWERWAEWSGAKPQAVPPLCVKVLVSTLPKRLHSETETTRWVDKAH